MSNKFTTIAEPAAPAAKNAAVFPPLCDRVTVVTGATASGKSEIAMALAETFARFGKDVEILSLDSIAVYRHMNIGTAKPSPSDRNAVPHHLLDLVEPDQDFSVAEYLHAAHAAVAAILDRGHEPLFVGGTPMFLKGILRGFDPGPPADPEFRAQAEADLQRYGIQALRERLRQVDPLAAQRIDPNDARRMIRALEFAHHTGEPISHRQTQFEHARSTQPSRVFALQVPRPLLHERIATRVDAMFDAGLIGEVSELINRFGQLSKTASQAVGYRELISALKTGRDPQDCRQEVLFHTRRLARRQETWFRSFTEIRTLPTHLLGHRIESQRIADAIHAQVIGRNIPSSP